MIRFFDVNYWVKEGESGHVDSRSMEEIDSNYQAVLTNDLSLNYHWDFGNENLTKNTLLINHDHVFFAYILTPDHYYYSKDFEKYIQECYQKKVRLFRFFPKTHWFYVYDNFMKKIFGILEAYRFPVMLDLKQLDITGNKYFQIDIIEKILKNHPNLPFILECSLKQLMFNAYFMPLLEEYENLSLEISGLIAIRQIEHYAQRFGASRLIYGTNHPSIDKVFCRDRLLLSDLDEQSKEDITFNNLEKIIKGIKK